MTAVAPRLRVIVDNDYSGDPDGLVQLAHHLLCPSVEIRAVIGSHLAPGDPFDSSGTTAANAAGRAREVVGALGLTGTVRVIAGSDVGLPDESSPHESAAAKAIVEEAMRDDTPLPLFVACGGGLTEIASAYLLEPRIAERCTLVWIGGPEYPDLAPAPPGVSGPEYNVAIDVAAARVVFNESSLRIWQVPRNAYRQVLASDSELDRWVRPHGAIGRLLFEGIESARTMAAAHGMELGETYILGDSPLVLLTALQSPFHPDASSSESALLAAPRFFADGSASFEGAGRPVRVFTRLDTRLLLGDLFAKLRQHASDTSGQIGHG